MSCYRSLLVSGFGIASNLRLSSRLWPGTREARSQRRDDRARDLGFVSAPSGSATTPAKIDSSLDPPGWSRRDHYPRVCHPRRSDLDPWPLRCGGLRRRDRLARGYKRRGHGCAIGRHGVPIGRSDRPILSGSDAWSSLLPCVSSSFAAIGSGINVSSSFPPLRQGCAG